MPADDAGINAFHLFERKAAEKENQSAYNAIS
jgi:hypothetical protein